MLAIPKKYTRPRENGIPRGDAPREEGHPSGASAASLHVGASPRGSPFLRARARSDKIRDYRIYSIKRHPRINATLESKHINKRRPRIDAAPMMRRLFQ